MNILVIYRSHQFPMRYAIADHLYALRRYSSHCVFYHNVFHGPAPGWLRSRRWDAVIFHNTFLIRRTGHDFNRLAAELDWIKLLGCVKAAIAQDENNLTDRLCAFLRDFGITQLFSVCPTEKEVETLYKGHLADDVTITRVLTGYAEPRRQRQFEAMRQRSGAVRDIDIGYRSFKAAARLGRVGVLKWKIAEVVQAAAIRRGLALDISNDVKDTLHGDEWLRFLLRCRYQLGVEGGSSVMDRDGAIKKACDVYERDHPDAPFEEIEAACFPGRDGDLRYAMITPRVFEAAMAGAGQIMVEGSYNGILKPDVHYIPLKEDFSNLEEVLDRLADEPARLAMVERAHRDLIASGDYSYARFTAQVMAALGGASESTGAGDRLLCVYNRLDEWRRNHLADAWQRIKNSAKSVVRRHGS